MEDNECKSVVVLLRFSNTKGIKGTIKAAVQVIRVKNKKKKWVTHSNPFFTVLTSIHLAPSSAQHVPLRNIRSLDDAAFFLEK